MCCSKVFGKTLINHVYINHVYRDRAAEKRALHGGFGVGHGQKKSEIRRGESSSPVSTTTKEVACEALDLALGAGSYARRMRENMGRIEVMVVSYLRRP
ncbi:hypothetical protein Dimus_018697 [Dionaea muscipula]